MLFNLTAKHTNKVDASRTIVTKYNTYKTTSRALPAGQRPTTGEHR